MFLAGRAVSPANSKMLATLKTLAPGVTLCRREPEGALVVVKRKEARNELLMHGVAGRSGWVVPVVPELCDSSTVVTPYYPGGDLLGLVERGEHRSLAVRDRARHGLARAVLGLHREGVYHRDVSLENAVLGEGGQVRLLDLELATTEPFTTCGACGKNTYMPRWVRQGSRYSNREYDLFALGVAIVVLTLGSPLFETSAEGRDVRYDLMMDLGVVELATRMGFPAPQHELDLVWLMVADQLIRRRSLGPVPKPYIGQGKLMPRKLEFAVVAQ